MLFKPTDDFKRYVRKQPAKERLLIFDEMRLFEGQTRKQLGEDERLLPVQGYKNLFEVRIMGAAGRHRFVGPIIDGKIYLLHSFLKQGKSQEQREFKTAWKRAQPYIKKLSKK